MEKASGLTLHALAVALGLANPDVVAAIFCCAAAAVGGVLISLESGFKKNLQIGAGSFLFGITAVISLDHRGLVDYLWAGPAISALVSYSPQLLDPLIKKIIKRFGL